MKRLFTAIIEFFLAMKAATENTDIYADVYFTDN